MITDLTSADDGRCMDLAERVGWPREAVKWRLLLSLGRGYATRERDTLTSMVMIVPHDGASFVAMMVVDPTLRRRGFGRRILEHALVEAARPVMLYATAAGQPLYENLGFEVVDGVHKLFGVAPSATSSLCYLTDREAFFAADARAVGVGRRRFLGQLLEVADRTVENGRGGYAVRFHNGAVNVVGPVIAESEDDAIELVDNALIGARGVCRVDVARSSPGLVSHLRARGFVEEAPAPLMLLGQPLAGSAAPGERVRYRAIALQAFG